jgi:hypothetical protein
MAEPIDLVYIGDKPVKKDTVTLSDLIFPRFEPVPTPADIALRLLRYPAVWRKASDLPSVKAENEAAQKAVEEEAERLAAEEAARLAAENMIVEPYGDIGKLTSAKARTLVEAEGLDIEQGAQEPIGEFRTRVRDALKAKLAKGAE